MIWFILLIGGGILAACIYFGMRQHNKLVGEGKIISRRTDFMESAEVFTLRAVDPGKVTEDIKAMDYADMHTSMKGSSERQAFRFEGSGWTAQLAKQDGEEGKSVYRFEFTGWKTRNGLAQDALNMNKLLTAVEKLFVSLDPDTQVTAVPLELQTKHSFL